MVIRVTATVQYNYVLLIILVPCFTLEEIKNSTSPKKEILKPVINIENQNRTKIKSKKSNYRTENVQGTCSIDEDHRK